MVVKQSTEQLATAKFLTEGAVSGYSITDLVILCDKHVRAVSQVSTSESISLARQFVKRCRKIDAEALLVALRAAGWTYLVAGKYLQAHKTYQDARKLALREPLIRARIDRTLIDVFMYLSRPDEARRYANRAIATFRRLGADDDLARTKVNYANVLHRQDRHREANVLYHSAAEHFRKRKDQLSTALCWYNEANTLVQLFDFDKAFELYTEARNIFEEKNHTLHAYGCLYGLAWLHMLKGNFHVALRDLAACETFYRSGGQKREMVLCQLDRAESYLGLNLLSEARRTACQAAKGARELGIKYEEAKAVFFAARAEIGMNQFHSARAHLRVARHLMSCERNREFLAAIDVTTAMLGRNSTERRREINLARTRSRSIQLPLWEAICDVEITVEQPNDPKALKRLDRNRAVQTVPHLYAQYGVLRGDQAAGKGKIEKAVRWWTKSAEVLDAVRTVLPPIEVRAAFLQGRRDPFRRLIATESVRNPRRAAVWVERSKTVGIWSPLDKTLAQNPARIQVQRSMADLAQHVAAISAITASGSGRRSARLAYQLPVLARMREQVRQELLTIYADREIDSRNPEFTLELLKKAADEIPIIQFHVGECDIQAFISYRGDCRVHTYRDGVRTLDNLVARWRFFVECAPSKTSEHRTNDIDDESTLIDNISKWLIDPLALPAKFEQVLIVPEDKLFCLPWLALKWRNEPIYQNLQIRLAPSVRHYQHSCRQLDTANLARIFVGESSGLDWVKEEVELVQKRLTGLTVEVFNPCRREDWPELSTAKVWHFAGHAMLRSDNPFYSALLLEHEQIFAADFRLKCNDVQVVTLAACRTGQQPGLPGEETSGLVRAILEMGARSIIAGGWAVADRSTSLWMDAFYSSLTSNNSTVESMNQAIKAVRQEYHSAFHWAAFAVYGAG